MAIRQYKSSTGFMKAPEMYVFSTLVTQFTLKLNILHVNLIVNWHFIEKNIIHY